MEESYFSFSHSSVPLTMPSQQSASPSFSSSNLSSFPPLSCFPFHPTNVLHFFLVWSCQKALYSNDVLEKGGNLRLTSHKRKQEMLCDIRLRKIGYQEQYELLMIPPIYAKKLRPQSHEWETCFKVKTRGISSPPVRLQQNTPFTPLAATETS